MLSVVKQGLDLCLCVREGGSAFCRSSFSWRCALSC